MTYLDWSLIPVKDNTGKVTGLVFTLAEVTERIRAEEALLKNEQKLNDVLDNAPVAIWCFDGKTYSYLSKEWYRCTGQDPTLPHAIDRWKELVHPDDLEESVQIWKKHWETKTPHQNIFWLKGADGDYKRIRSRLFAKIYK